MGNATSDYLAVDLGATSGRAVIGRFDGCRLTLEEIHRFANSPIMVDGALRWNMPLILGEIDVVLVKVASTAPDLVGVGCDTWGLDHGFLGSDGWLLAWPCSYQDGRTQSVVGEVAKHISTLDLVRRTGAPHTAISTLHQLLATRRDWPDLMEQAACFLFMPGLVHHHLTGVAAAEPCIASTSQLWDWRANKWDDPLIDGFDLPRRIFPAVPPTGTSLGALRTDLRKRLALPDTWTVWLPPGHDTAAAFIAAPRQGDGDLVLSSGTWSMLCLPVAEPIATEEVVARTSGTYATVGGWFFAYGLMGLALLERYRREERAPEPAVLAAKAARAQPAKCLFDPSDPRFMCGKRFLETLSEHCRQNGQPMPMGHGSVVRSILESLALFYHESIGFMERATGRRIERIVVVGGGARNRLLNRLTADATGRPVAAGPSEATVMGNVLTQALGRGELNTADDIRKVVLQSWPSETFEPRDQGLWEEVRQRFAGVRQAAFADSGLS